MLALVRSFLASRTHDRKVSPEEILAFSERTGIPITVRQKDASIAKASEGASESTVPAA